MKNPVKGKDIVIIGSGIGGLSAGILLSLFKFKVTLVEKNPLPGGLMSSYERSGFDCPVGVHYVGALGDHEPLGMMFRLMGVPVDELFVPLGKDGIIDRYIFDDLTFDLPTDIDALELNLKKTFLRDVATLETILKNLRDIYRQMHDPLFLMGQGGPFQNMDYYQSMGEMLDALGTSPGLRAVLAVPCQLIGVPLNDCPVIFHHMVLASYLLSSWKPGESGSKMTDAFVNRFRELGGSLVLNNGVKKITLTDHKVSGVMLESGDSLSCDAVVAAIHPKIILGLLPEDTLRESFVRRIRGLKETESVIAVNARVKKPDIPDVNHNIYRLTRDDKGNIVEGIFFQFHGDSGESSLLSIITKSLYGDWSRWENTVSGRRGQDYEEKKNTIALKLLKKAEEIFGDLTDARILDVFTPLTIRDYVNAPEGACYGVLRSARQLLKIFSLHNIPLPGLYLAGQNALAPGVLGCVMGSFNLARQIVGAEKFVNEIMRDAQST